MKICLSWVVLPIFLLLASCGAMFNQPLTTSNARIGEATHQNSILQGIEPETKMEVGVYKFRDQTGQYKMVENGSTFSTAVTQGGTSILLKALEESKWFRVIERENIGNLLNERQIIRSTRQEYAQETNTKPTPLPPLLFAGMIIEGGVISYDSNIITGGSGARYFGAGASAQYREDRITVYLRAVSTSSGEVLKNIYVSKTILSQGISANLFRYVNVRRLLEVETGVTKNEPVQIAVKEAIDKALELLIAEGIVEGLWLPKGGEQVVNSVREKLAKEKQVAENTLLYDRKMENRRGRSGIGVAITSMHMDGDYGNPEGEIGASFSYKHIFNNPKFQLNFDANYLKLTNKGAFSRKFIATNLNLLYNILPYENISPFISAGLGSITDSEINNTFYKFQYGVGVEFLLTNKLGIEIFGEQNILFSDELDGITNGKRDDYYWRVGIGLNFYLGSPYKKINQTSPN